MSELSRANDRHDDRTRAVAHSLGDEFGDGTRETMIEGYRRFYSGTDVDVEELIDYAERQAELINDQTVLEHLREGGAPAAVEVGRGMILYGFAVASMMWQRRVEQLRRDHREDRQRVYTDGYGDGEVGRERRRVW